MAEALKGAGYATCLSGKWHLCGATRNPNEAWLTRRGFDRFFGTLTGCGSYYDPGTLARNEVNAEADVREPSFFYTDAISDEAAAFVREQRAEDPDRRFFLSDNGASAEPLPGIHLDWFLQKTDAVRRHTRDGRPVHLGNDPDVMPGGEDTYASYGRAWASLSNTPFRYYKRWVHEGGIATPLVARWPNGGLSDGIVVRTPFQLTDLLPTVLEAIGSDYPVDHTGRDVLPMEGRSMLPALRGEPTEAQPLYWEHCGNAAIRRGRWKLVRGRGSWSTSTSTAPS